MSPPNFARCRREFPEFGRLAAETIAWCRANPRRTSKPRSRKQSSRSNIRGPVLTGVIAGPSSPIFDAVMAAVPHHLDREKRMEVIAALALAVVEEQIAIDEVKSKVPEFIRTYNRTYPTKYGPASLDAPAFRDSPLPMIETISSDRAMWEELA